MTSADRTSERPALVVMVRLLGLRKHRAEILRGGPISALEVPRHHPIPDAELGKFLDNP